jgi:hypothetical protein
MKSKTGINKVTASEIKDAVTYAKDCKDAAVKLTIFDKKRFKEEIKDLVSSATHAQRWADSQR